MPKPPKKPAGKAPPPRRAARAAPGKELEQLLSRISTGSITDVDELNEQDLRLLREWYGEGEDLQTLLDELRGEER